jgi:hypothetical protein
MTGLAAGTYRLAVSGPGFLALDREITVRAGAPTDLGVLTVQRGQTLRGRVIANGAGVPGATVLAGLGVGGGNRLEWELTQQQRGVRRAISDADGWFTVPGVEPGACAVAEHARAGRSVEIAVPARDAAPLELALARTGAVRGRVLRGGRGVVAELSVTRIADDSGCAARFAVASDGDGAYLLTGLAPGRYRFTAQYEIMSTRTSREIEITAGAMTAFDLQLPIGQTAQIILHQEGASRAAWGALLPGDHQPATPDELAALMRDLPDATVWWNRLTADEALQPNRGAPLIFANVPRGHYTACVWQRMPGSGALACQPFDLGDGVTVTAPTTR